MFKRKKTKTVSVSEQIVKDKLTITLDKTNMESKSYGPLQIYTNYKLNNNFLLADVESIIGDTVEALLLPDNEDNYLKHKEFIEETISDYSKNINTTDSDLNTIIKIFETNMKSINYLKDNQNFPSSEIEKLYKVIFSVKSAENDIFINHENYTSLNGVESSKKQREDLGIDSSKLLNGQIPSNFDSNIEMYKTYILDYLKFMYILQKNVYDQYIYYIMKIVEIHQQIENIKPFVWEEEYLVSELIKIYSSEILEKLKKYRDLESDKKETIKKEIILCIDSLNQEISKNLNYVSNGDILNRVRDNLESIKEGLDSGILKNDDDYVIQQVGEQPQPSQQSQPQPSQQSQPSQQPQSSGPGLATEVVGAAAKGFAAESLLRTMTAGAVGGSKRPRKRTPVKRR